MAFAMLRLPRRRAGDPMMLQADLDERSGRLPFALPQIAVLAAAALVGATILLTGAGAGVDRILQDVRYAVRAHDATGEIHVVEIDAKSLAALTKWPLPRSVHGRAVDQLRAAGARTIGFDVDFSAASDPREDAAFAAALKRAGGSVYLATFRQAADSTSEESVENIPIKILEENAFLAGVNVRPDASGYVRQMPLGTVTGGTPRPSLANLTAEVPADTGEAFDIDYSIRPETIPRHSLIDLVTGRVPAAALAGKRVIIGATAIEIRDYYATPRHGVIPGVVIQALAAETLMQGPIPQSWSGGGMLLLALAAAAGILRKAASPRRLAGFGAATAVLPLIPLASEHFFAVSMALAPALGSAATVIGLNGAALLAQRARRKETTDAATGLPNLAALEGALAGRAQANIVVAHIEHFAMIASGLGDEATAKLILRVADRLRLACGDMHIYRVDTAALAWIETPDDESSLDGRLEAAAALMRAPVECGRLVDVSLTFGLSGSENLAGSSVKQLVADAALAAVHAAQRGNRWQKFTEADSEEATLQLSLLGELDAAMASGELWNAYQPKLDLHSGKVLSVEALVRWNHAQRGPIGPDKFIPLVEEHGRAADLTRHVLQQALEDAWSWQERGHPINVAVNVSASVLADHGFIESVREALRTSPVPPERITIEVTESAAMNDPARAIAALESWRALGVRISIDDYGTGQSSLGYLQTLPATELKIDKSFVQTIASDTRNAIMVRSTIAMAHELGLKVVAEGIEDQECLDRLREMGCDTAQGFFISKPLSAPELADFLGTGARAAA
ncbi:EAL domain-containing protein [Sphingomonas parva]|nr:EAL domain-containing protein [Sphingomonas parva]